MTALTPAYELEFRTATLEGSKIIFTDGQTATIEGAAPSEVTLDSTDGVHTTPTSWVRIPSVQIQTEFTIELYVKIISHASWHGFFSLSDGTGIEGRDNMLHMGNLRNNNQLYLISSNGTYTHDFSNKLLQGPSEDSGTFYNLPFDAHIVWANDSTGSKVYLNGVEQQMYAQNGLDTDYGRSGLAASNNYIGRSAGNLADSGTENTRVVRVYNTKLSAAEVTQLYADRDRLPYTPPSSPVTATGAQLQIIPNFNLNELIK